MGCNVEKAKLEIYEILVKDQKKSDEKTVENINKLAEEIASKLDSDIKSNFIMSVNDKNKTNTLVTSEKKSSEEFSASFLKERPYKSRKTVKRENFDKLPNYNSQNPTFLYAGVGSRETPQDILDDMASVASWLDSQGYKLQTGYKSKNKDGSLSEEGADKAFSSGTSNKELFGPDMSNDLARNIAKEIHPLGNGLTVAKGLNFHARNTFQVFGKNLDTPVDFVLFYAQETNSIRPKGGTGQAVHMARLKGIPTVNIWNNPNWKRQVMAIVKKNQSTKNNPKENNDISEDTNSSKDENKHSALVKVDNILKDIDNANSEVSKFIKPLLRDYFKKQKLSVKPFINAMSLALNGDIGQKATAQKGIDAIFKITRDMDQKDVPFEKFTNEEINFLVDNHFMSEPEIKIVDIKDLKTETKEIKIEFDNDVKKFGSQASSSENTELVASFSNSVENLLVGLVDMNDNSPFGQNLKNIGRNISETLSHFGLSKTLKVNMHSILDKNDRYTRASFTMNSESAVERIDQETGIIIGFDLEAGEINLLTGYGYGTEEGDISLNTSNQILIHEILHSMIEKAVDADPSLSKAIFDVKEYVMDRISPKDFFASEEEYKNATEAERKLAEDLYSYMHKPTEFLIYTMTTKNIFNAVNKIKIKKEFFKTFKPKPNEELGKIKQFLNKFIEIINKIYTTQTTKTNALADLNSALMEAIQLNTQIDIGMKVKQDSYSEYKAFGLGTKLNKTNEWLKDGQEGVVNKISNFVTSDKVRDKAEYASNFIENISNWRHFQFIRDSRIISDTVTDIVEDTTKESASWFYEAVRKIKNNRDKDKVDFAAVVRNKLGDALKHFEKEEREAMTFMLQGDWKALNVSIDEYKDLLQNSDLVDKKINELKTKIGLNEYNNQAALLGYYIVTGEAKGSALMKNAYQIYHRFHTGKQTSPLKNSMNDEENISAIDELASLYAIKYTENHIKENIVNAINRDSESVKMASDIHYGYKAKENSGQLGRFGKFADKGYVRKSGKVEMKFDIIPESKLIDKSWFNFLKHNIVRERPDIQELMGSSEKYYMVIDRNYDTARTQGALDDISIIDHGSDLGSFTAGKDLDFEVRNALRKKRFFKDKTYLNLAQDDSIEAMRARENNSVAEFNIYGEIESYSEPISEADLINHGRVINDVADVIANTTSNIESKEKALINNQRFIDLLIEDSEKNIGAPGYVFLSPDSSEKELQEYWAMIPNYSRGYIEMQTESNGIWVKRSRINNIVGYKDVSLSNLKLFGLKLENYPQWQKAIRIIEAFWKEIASQYKAIIVKLMPDVIIGNGLSNMIVAFKHGIGPIEYAKEFRTAWTDLSDYLELNEKKIWLEIERESGKKGLDARIAELEERLKNNGMHNLIADGQFSMIFEDLDNNTEERVSHLHDILYSKAEKMFGKKTADRLNSIRESVYITQGTRGHRAIEKLTIYNDIINKRIIEKKLLQDMDKITFNDDETRQQYIQDIYNYLDQLFTNYGYLLNKYLKYPSDMNFLMFIKYFLRQGKAVLSTARRQPLGSAIAEATDMFVWNMPDPIDQYQNLGGTLANKIGASPIDVFGEIIYPRFLTILGN